MADQEVEDMKEFMEVLTDVKVSMAELNGKIDQLTDMKETLAETKKTADDASYRSLENEKDIQDIQSNNRKTTVALITVVGAFVFQILFFLLTFNF
ncbi:vacuolar-type H+-ATPase subunit I/STV1 [Virgibacillus natechei]|uniref:Vacuolar-type H+-ATPase subunit I/STV1 n=1 Tax=Virgibacillus natechei TaxID=1216297 RepID=A0ABS4IKS8_9BACI|nr:hypothetical protein [Virgibacillus natechei]MBP1971567.1 vacuolar-type H+-ATPase subunit I/STV1 [Virgibacillus natechei]UZD13099.1 hypothetical protein OLD84_00530 [Virgibacillus natechei]